MWPCYHQMKNRAGWKIVGQNQSDAVTVQELCPNTIDGSEDSSINAVWMEESIGLSRSGTKANVYTCGNMRYDPVYLRPLSH